MDSKLQDFLESARQGAGMACRLMMQYYRGSYEVYSKDGAHDRAESILTEPDILCDKALQDHFTRLYPEHSVVSEESEDSLPAGWPEKAWIWYIDPIDGSLSYSKGTDNFGTAICLAHKGEPVLGVVSNPAREYEAWSAKGAGAFLNGESVSFRSSGHWPPRLILSNRQKSRTSYRRTIDIMKPEKFLIMESVVTKAITLLRGEGDLYFSLPHEVFSGGCPKVWDVAAAAAVVAHAGGAATDIYGEPICLQGPDLYWRRGFIFAHPDIFSEAQSLLSKLTAVRKSGVPPHKLALE